MVYAAGSDLGAGTQLGPMMDRLSEKFWKLATKKAISVAEAVELALKEMRDEINRTGEGRLGMRTTFGVFVCGDTVLY